jgi:hypothetical protein
MRMTVRLGLGILLGFLFVAGAWNGSNGQGTTQ